MKSLINENHINYFVMYKSKILFIILLTFIIIAYPSISNILKINNTFATQLTDCTSMSSTSKITNYKCIWSDDQDRINKLNLYPMPKAIFAGRNFLTKEGDIYLKSGTVIITSNDNPTIVSGDTKINEEYYKKLDGIISNNDEFNDCNENTYNKISSGSNIYGIFSNTEIKNITQITTNITYNNYRDTESNPNNTTIYKRMTNLKLEKGYEYCAKLEKGTDIEYFIIDNSNTTPPIQITISGRKLYKRCTSAIVQFKTNTAIKPNGISLILYDENNKQINQIKPVQNEQDNVSTTNDKNMYHEIVLTNLKRETYFFQIQIKTEDGSNILDNKYALYMDKQNMQITTSDSGCFNNTNAIGLN